MKGRGKQGSGEVEKKWEKMENKFEEKGRQLGPANTMNGNMEHSL